jgi:hypothetical protein
MNIRYPDHRSAVMSMSSLDDLTTLGFRADLIARLKALVNDDCPPKAVVAAVLSVLASTAAGKRLGRNARRLIRRAERACPPTRLLLREVIACVLGASHGGSLSNGFEW